MKKIKKNNIIIILMMIIIIAIVIFFYYYNLGYFIAYTLDYLINRNGYTFKEESQFSDNNIKEEKYILTYYLDYIREEKLKKMPKIEAMPLPEIKIEELSRENIMKISKNFTQPFIIRNLIKDFDCVKKWDLDYFEKEYGDINILAFSDTRVSYSREGGSKLKKCNNDNNLCSIKEICRGIKKGEPIYINNISTLFTVNEKARNELNLDKIDKIINEYFIEKKIKSQFLSQLFLGGKNTGTSLHCASNINFFFNIKGEKKWGFIDPKYTELIHCQTSDKGLFSISPDDYFSTSEDNKFLKIPRYESLLCSGDFLFNPTWYWHAVQNKTVYTIAVANRYTTYQEIPTISNNKFFSFLQLFSPIYYSNWYFKDKNKTHQEIFGKIVDQEIINNISQSNSM